MRNVFLVEAALPCDCKWRKRVRLEDLFRGSKEGVRWSGTRSVMHVQVGPEERTRERGSERGVGTERGTESEGEIEGKGERGRGRKRGERRERGRKRGRETEREIDGGKRKRKGE